MYLPDRLQGRGAYKRTGQQRREGRTLSSTGAPTGLSPLQQTPSTLFALFLGGTIYPGRILIQQHHAFQYHDYGYEINYEVLFNTTTLCRASRIVAVPVAVPVFSIRLVPMRRLIVWRYSHNVVSCSDAYICTLTLSLTKW